MTWINDRRLYLMLLLAIIAGASGKAVAQTGACCLATSCVNRTEAACLIDGSYQGDGTDCNPNVPYCECNSVDLSPLVGPYRYNGHIYTVLDQRNRVDAVQAAQCLNGHLIIIDDAAEDDWIQHTVTEIDMTPDPDLGFRLGGHFWIGFASYFRGTDLEGCWWEDVHGQELPIDQRFVGHVTPTVPEMFCVTGNSGAKRASVAWATQRFQVDPSIIPQTDTGEWQWHTNVTYPSRFVVVEALDCNNNDFGEPVGYPVGGLAATIEVVGIEYELIGGGRTRVDLKGCSISRVCTDDSDCEGANGDPEFGTCLPSGRCSGFECETTADCSAQNLGTCLGEQRFVASRIDPVVSFGWFYATNPQPSQAVSYSEPLVSDTLFWEPPMVTLNLPLDDSQQGRMVTMPAFDPLPKTEGGLTSSLRFTAKWSGFVIVEETAPYVFYLRSGYEDAGVNSPKATLKLCDGTCAGVDDDMALIFEEGPGAAAANGSLIVGAATLEAGTRYGISVEYENFGLRYPELPLLWPYIRLEWSHPGKARQVIPPQNLIPGEFGDSDCNDNGVLDACEVANCPRDPTCVAECPQVDPDCVIDCPRDFECVADCGVVDASCRDCNGNQVPDVCEIDEDSTAPGGPFFCTGEDCEEDCNDNGVLDECERGDDWDCNDSKIWDECELNETTDCNGNRVLDECELSVDCQADFLTANDHCDQDAVDALVKGVPDDCELDLNDFNRNGIPDDCDICNGLIIDCNRNGYPDRCEVTTNDPVCDTVPRSADCNGNRVPDECEIDMDRGDEFFCDSDVDSCDSDCNHNGVLDSCDVSDRTSADCDDNTVPDECEISVLDGGDCIIAKGFFDPVAGRTFGCDSDCNGNGKVDICDIPVSEKGKCTAASCPASDCDGNGTPDECQIRAGTTAHPDGPVGPFYCVANCFDDCVVRGTNSGNGLIDSCETTLDALGKNYYGMDIGFNGDGKPNNNCNPVDPARPGVGDTIPNECDSDCDKIDGSDLCQLLKNPWMDCHLPGELDVEGVLDVCEIPESQGGKCTAASCPASDCDGNGTPDVCDIRTGEEQDCNNNITPDKCEIMDGLASDCNGNLVIDECELGGGDCNNDGLLDACQIILSEDDEFHLADCNDDGVADICGIAGLLDEVTGAAGRNFFQRNRNAGSTYQDMIAAYGRPWKRTAVPPTNSGLTPGSDPASRLRALNRFRTCSDALENVLPVLPELFAFEMLLGNEAFADALDPTIGLSGVDANDIGDRFAFEGIVDSLLDEELALLRGLSLPEGTNWLDRDVYYPPYGGQGLTHAAVYNRLPPNAAGGIAAAAYISNYGPGINNNFDAATRFPQGHGDAFGYYLKATKVYLEVFRGNPRDAALGDIDGVDDPQLGVTAQLAQNLIDHQPDDNEELLSGRLNDADLPYQSLRNMARAMAARARTALRIVEKTYRRDFTEDHASPAAGQLFQDSNPERAWAMADWARRGGLGAYFDWALTNQLLPPSPPELSVGFDAGRDSTETASCFDAYDGTCDDASTFGDCFASGGKPLASGNTCDDIPETLPRVHRGTVNELLELANVVAEMQERVDTAGLGLNPLGLLANAVPFGINASELGEGTGRSPYEQVADAAGDALSNARMVLEHANSANQRLREQGQSQTMFARQVEESAADFNNQLIDLFGYPSADDPADNDFDPSTSDLQEAGIEPGVTGGPDLLNFLLDVEERGWRERLAPGEIQMRLSEVEVAGTAVAQAKLAAQILVAEIEDLQEFREFLAQEGDDIDGIYDEFGTRIASIKTNTVDAVSGEISTLNTIADIMHVASATVFGAFNGTGSCTTMEFGFCRAAMGALGGIMGAADAVADLMYGDAADLESGAIFDYQDRVTNLNAWRSVQLARTSVDIQHEEQALKLQSLIRQVPQTKLNIETVKEGVRQAFSRFNATLQRGHRLVAEQNRVREIQRQDLQQHRWTDLAYRNFRNDALAKYEAFFELAARYVLLAGRAYAYEYNARSQSDAILNRIYKERRLSALDDIITDLDNLATVNNFNAPLTSIGQRSFSLRQHLLGFDPTSAVDDLRFRAFLEDHIEQKLEDLSAMQDSATLSVTQHFGPAIVISFSSEIQGHNFFGNGPDPPFGNANFPVSLNTKIRNFAIRIEGVTDFAALGIDETNPFVSVFFMPIGQSILRENTNARTVEENLPRPWMVVDQWLPAPPLLSSVEDLGSSFSPWRSTGEASGNFLNAVKRFRETEADLDIPDPITGESAPLLFKPDLAGRAVWNDQWLLVIPGGQWTGSTAPEVIRDRLLTLIYGPTGDPRAGEGVTDIRIVFQAYSH